MSDTDLEPAEVLCNFFSSKLVYIRWFVVFSMDLTMARVDSADITQDLQKNSERLKKEAP
jgi:hypothetical protein